MEADTQLVRISMPDRYGIDSPFPAFPIREVTEIVYLDEAQAEQTLAPADW